MAQYRPPPDWHLCEERTLEDHVRGEDEELARAALLELRRRHDDLRTRVRSRCGGNKDLEGEALQSLDTKLWEKRKLYDPAKGRWIQWAKTILGRIVIDLFRERARSGDTPDAETAEPNPPPGDWTARIPGREPPADWRLKLQELQQAMTDCLQRLPSEEREALIFQVLGERSLREIGEQTAVPPGTAGARIFRGKHRMRACLRRKGYEGGEV
jgi:RNA polymerase sigma factor (sigma-70 family)